MPRSTPRNFIEVWPATAPGQPSASTHLWYQTTDSFVRRICDDSDWPGGHPLISAGSRIRVPCLDCRGLYLEDAVRGPRRLDTIVQDVSPFQSKRYPPKMMGYSPKEEALPMAKLPLGTIGLTTFAHFYEASPPEKVRIVREARLNQIDRRRYAARDYYRDLRNAARVAHWETNDIAKFEAVLPSLIAAQKLDKQENYHSLGERYVAYFKKSGAELFKIERETLSLAGLDIVISPEFGMRIGGDELVVKISLTGTRPKREFRQVVQHLTARALARRHPAWQPVIWDVRREVLLPHVSIPKDFDEALELEAASFRGTWERLDSEEAIDF